MGHHLQRGLASNSIYILMFKVVRPYPLLGIRRILSPYRYRQLMATSYKLGTTDLSSFRKDFSLSKRVVVLTGAGASAESGVPTFRGAGGLWRTFRAQDLATPQAFRKNPSLVWEFYHYRREVMQSKQPNAAHIALAQAEARLVKEGRRLCVITQNIDELHQRAGSSNVIELHGTLFKTKCTSCSVVEPNYEMPICPALAGRGAPDPDADGARIPTDLLPRCMHCEGLLRPYVVWFGEALDTQIMESAQNELDACDLCLVVGTSAVVYPAAMFAPQVMARGVPVAEFNIQATSNTDSCKYFFEGPCGTVLPTALAP